MDKQNIEQFAAFGGPPMFAVPKPTSGLHRPPEALFFSYADSLFYSRQLTNNGPLVKLLEQRLANLHGTEYCVCFCSGFLALLLAIHTLALPGKNEVIMPSATYRRMSSIIRWADLKPKFSDIDPQTFGVSAELYQPLITDKTSLLLGVHPIVNMSSVESLETLSRESGIPLLFDSVEAAYGTIAGKKIGSFGIAEVFSMHASKFINGFEGGYITTNNSQLCETLKSKRAFGFKGVDNIVEIGCNAKLNELHAAMSLACLDTIEDQISHNKKIFQKYKDGLRGLPLEVIEYDNNERRTWKNIVVRMHEGWNISRDEFIHIMNAENILARTYYSPPLHMEEKECFSFFLPVTVSVTSSTLILPSGAHVSEDDVEEITRLIHFVHKIQNDLKKQFQKTK